MRKGKKERMDEAILAASRMRLSEITKASALEAMAFQVLTLEAALEAAGVPYPFPMSRSYRDVPEVRDSLRDKKRVTQSGGKL